MVYSSELGHHSGRFYRDQDGNLVLPSSADLIVQAGGNIRDENFETLTDTSTAIATRGYSRLAVTALNTFSLAGPPYPGISKDIVCFTTLLTKVRSAVPINFATGPTRVIEFPAVAPTTRTSTESEAFPQGVSLYAVTTALWAITSVLGTTDAVVFSSAT